MVNKAFWCDVTSDHTLDVMMTSQVPVYRQARSYVLWLIENYKKLVFSIVCAYAKYYFGLLIIEIILAIYSSWFITKKI